MRRCIACRESKPQDELIRFTFDGTVIAADKDGKNDGRGFYLCNSAECLENAIRRKAFNRACKRNIDTEQIRKVVDEVISGRQGGMDVKES